MFPRIRSTADSENGKTDWIKSETPSFDPSDPDNPAYRWTQPPPIGFNFRGAWQAHCTGDIRADGVHMVLTVSNQNYPQGGRIAYYWSPDWADTWIGHPDNPIIVAGEHPDGVPATGFQRTPTLLIGEEYNRYILAYNAGHDADEPARRHTYLAMASRPVDPSDVGPDGETSGRFGLDLIEPNPNLAATRIRFELPVAGRLRVQVIGVDGRLVSEIANREFSAGRRTVVWDKTANDGSRGSAWDLLCARFV